MVDFSPITAIKYMLLNLLVLVFYCSVTNDHNLIGLQQHSFIIS